MRDGNNNLYSNKGNSLIQGYAWNLKEKQLKIMEFLCSSYMTSYYNEEHNTITVGIADFMREIGLSTKGQNNWDYDTFKAAIKKLSDTSIIAVGFTGRERIIRLINTAEFPQKDEDFVIVCHMSEDFKECMKRQDKGNTRIEFRTVCSLDSRYSIRLYNLLRSWQGRGEVYFDLDYLKSLLSVTAKSYNNFAKFRQSVLDIAVNEINAKTNLQVSYQPVTGRGRGGKIARIIFTISDAKKSLPAAGKKSATDPEPFPAEDADDGMVKDAMALIPEEVHGGSITKVEAILEIARELIAPKNVEEFLDIDGNSYGTSLDRLRWATEEAAEDYNERILHAIKAYVVQDYNTKRDNIQIPAAKYKYFLAGFQGWLLTHCQY